MAKRSKTKQAKAKSRKSAKRARDQSSADRAEPALLAQDQAVIAVDFSAAREARPQTEGAGPAAVIDLAAYRQQRSARAVQATPPSQSNAIFYDAEMDEAALGAALLKLIEESERR